MKPAKKSLDSLAGKLNLNFGRSGSAELQGQFKLNFPAKESKDFFGGFHKNISLYPTRLFHTAHLFGTASRRCSEETGISSERDHSIYYPIKMKCERYTLDNYILYLSRSVDTGHLLGAGSFIYYLIILKCES